MFYKLSNLASMSVEPVEAPWALGVSVPATVTDKDEYKKWLMDPATKHALVSPFEGLSPVVRIGKDNPIVRMHGLVVDYDFRSASADKLRELKASPVCEWVPSWGSISFRKGAKLYWKFERPIPVSPGVQVTKFLARLAKEMKLGAWLPGFDAGATANTVQYYEVGRDFVEIGGKPIPHEILVHWAWDSVRDTVLWSDFSRYEIPLEEIEREVHDRFPGRWKGQFKVGERGVRFWDPTADNPTGAQIRADGMTCYTGDKFFVSWAEIFGQKFVARFAASKTQQLLESTYYDGMKFYSKAQETDEFIEWGKEDFSQLLRTKGFDPTRGKGRTCSEIDEAEIAIKTLHRVQYARRLVHFNKGEIRWRGRRFLNMGAAEPIQPAPPMGQPMSWADGDKYFPMLKSFFDTFFANDQGEDEHNQRTYLFAWLKRFYEGGLAHQPTQGQVVIIAGHPNKGKSFFSEGIVGGLMGGAEDGSDYLVDGGRWTENVSESPIMYIGDQRATEDYRTVTSFSNRLKQVVANATMRAAQKYGKEGDIPWFGRIIVSCNLDSESLSILPNMEISNREKISLFRASSLQFDFPDRAETDRKLAQELPFFGRFLLDWKFPAAVLGETRRFGVAHFHHPELLETAVQQGSSGLLVEYLRDYMRLDAASAKGQRNFWRGTATQLYAVLSEASPQFTREFRSVRAFQTCLGQVKNRKAMRIESERSPKHGGTFWTLYHEAAVEEGGGDAP